MPFKQLGLSIEKNIPKTAAFCSKNFSSVWTAEVFCTAMGIQSDSAFRDTWDLLNCHTFVTEHLSLLAYISKVLLYRCQDICRFFHSHYTKINKQDNKTKLFVWLSRCFQLAASSYERSQPDWLGFWDWSHFATLFLHKKCSLCSFGKLGWPGYWDLGPYKQDLDSRDENFPILPPWPGNQGETFFTE